MKVVSFNLLPVTKKPSRRFRKGSKYDPIGKDANYVRIQLKKRIDSRDLKKQIEVSVVNNIIYLEKRARAEKLH